MRRISARQSAAEVIRAGVTAMGLGQPYGVSLALEPWGRGKRYAVAFCVPGTDFQALVNRPDEIVLVGAGPYAQGILGAYSSPALLLATLYARLIACKLQLIVDVRAGTVDPEHAIPPGVIGDIICALPLDVRLPEPFYRVYQAAVVAELEAANAA